MLCVDTYLAASPIHGVGVFAAEHIAAGQLVWRYVPGFDLVYARSEFAALPQPARDFIARYAYIDVTGHIQHNAIILTNDNDRYMNHSPQPNIHARGSELLAQVEIARGDELTINYGILDGKFNNRTHNPLHIPIDSPGAPSNPLDKTETVL